MLVDISSIANIISSLALVITAFVVLQELRQTNRLAKAANTETLVSLSSPFNMSLIRDREMAELYVEGAKRFSGMDHVDKFRYRTLLMWWLILHENIYYQWKQDLLDTHSYNAWARELANFVREQNLRTHWDELEIFFQDAFQDHITKLIHAADSNC